MQMGTMMGTASNIQHKEDVDNVTGKNGSDLVTPSSSQQEEDVDTIIVNNVIPYIEDDEPANVSYPNLITTSSVAHKEALNDMKLRPVKRKRKGSARDNDYDNWELLGSSGGRDWLGRRGFEEMNVDYFIGIRNKKSRTVKFIEVDRSFSFRPSLGPRQWKDDDVKEEEDQERTYAERRKELLQSFGGKKSVQRQERYERDRITDEKLGEEATTGVNAAAAEMKERDAKEGINQVAPTTTESAAPPHDNNAKRPEDAYPLEGLTTPDELASLSAEAENIIEGLKDPTFENPGWHDLVWELMQSLVAMTNISEEDRRTRLKAAAYLHYLMVLAVGPSNLTFQAQEQMSTDMGVYRPILHRLLDRFTIPDPREDWTKVQRIRRNEDLTRVISYAVVMWLTVLGFKDCRRMGELAKALGLHEVRTLLRQAASLGCKIRKSKGQKGPQAYSISLPIPLKFPPVRKRVGKPERKR